MEKSRFFILDGGSATELVRQGHKSIDDDPLWSARLLQTNPEAIVQMHKSFLESGSDIIETVSYQASVGGFVEYLGVTEKEAVQLIKNSVELAQRACREVADSNNSPLGKVAGSVGPYGACLSDGSEYAGAYMDKVTEKDLTDWHRPRIKELVDAGVDYVAIETMPAQKEAECIAKLIETEFPNAKSWVAFSCKNGEGTCHGEKFRDAIQSVSRFDHVIAVGVNCTDPQYITPLLKCIQPLGLQKPVIVKPNSGEQWERGPGCYGGKEDYKRLCEYAEEWIQHGGMAKKIASVCVSTLKSGFNMVQDGSVAAVEYTHKMSKTLGML